MRIDSKPRILFVGRRKGAIRAARRMGCIPVVLEKEARAEQARFAYGDTPGAALDRCLALFGKTERPDAVIAVAEGAVPAAAAIREHFGLTGITSEDARGVHDKCAMKSLMQRAGIPCAKGFTVTERDTPESVADRLGLPLVLKIPISSGGRGVQIVRSMADLAAAMRPGLLAEAFVYGVEMSVECLLFDGRPIFRNHTRYLVPRWANVLPADLPVTTARQVDALTDRVNSALNLHEGITHMEVFLTPEGPIFGEIAARPPGGGLMRLIKEAYEFDPWEALIDISLGRRPDVPQRAASYAGNWLLHPGEGTIRSIQGLDEAAQPPGIVAVECRAQPGDVISERIGSGQSVGSILAAAEDHETCAASLASGMERIRFEMDDLST